MNPQAVIRTILQQYSVPEETIKQWIAVSAFETTGWTSPVFNKTKNLFNIIVPGSTRLDHGEGQTIYATLEESVVGLHDHVLKPFKYPTSFASIDEQVKFMKSKGFFTAALNTYIAGVNRWYVKLFS